LLPQSCLGLSITYLAGTPGSSAAPFTSTNAIARIPATGTTAQPFYFYQPQATAVSTTTVAAA